MKIAIDSFMRIGKGHTICEDYCIHGTDPFPYVILADGCSSSKNTDVGARILTYMAQKYLINNWPIKSIIYEADTIRKALGLNSNCLDATLIIAHQKWVNNEYINIQMYGDGAVIVKYKDDETVLHEISYTKSMPYYLSYQLNRQRDASYRNEDVTKRVYNSCSKGTIMYSPYDGEWMSFDLKSIKSLSITTDGISSFLSQKKGLMQSNQVAKELPNFKNTNGAFVQRRCKRMIKNLEKEGYYHMDDFSVGGFYFK